MPSSRNPVWERDELILALDLYFRWRPRIPPGENHPDVLELSETLRRLPLFPQEMQRENFRNPSGVYMKLANFQYIDPEANGGLDAFGQRDLQVWNEFAAQPALLHATARAIGVNAPKLDTIDSVDLGVDEAIEGRVLLVTHRQRERNSAIVKRRKDKALNETGRLECEVCGFDFAATYGDIGRGFIECHHMTPLSALEPGRPTRVVDLALVCANCHRVIHRTTPMPSPAELRLVLQRRKPPSKA